MGFREEKSFPRGGKDPGAFKKRSTVSGSKIRKVKGFAVKTSLKQDVEQSVKRKKLPDIRLITNKTVQPGMLTLGCIASIKEFELKVNLPGFITGFVTVNNISESCNRSLQQVLDGEKEEIPKIKEMFKVGQFVVVKVLETKDFGRNYLRIMLTLNPKDLHSDINRKDIYEGFPLSSAVKSIEEHGYNMDVGIKGVRAFLKKKNVEEFQQNWNDGKSLVIGQIVRCLVTKCFHDETATTVELTANLENTLEVNDNESKFISDLMPGMLVQTCVTKIDPTGLTVKFGNGKCGYVHRSHLETKSCALNNISIGDSFPARILYMEPLTNAFYLTFQKCVFNSNIPPPFETIKKGDIIENAKVVYLYGGVILSLSEKDDVLGFVGPHYIDQYDSINMRKRFPKGSLHKCRVIDYDYLIQGFLCSVKKSIFNEKFLSIEDCEVGALVKCTVEKVSMRGIEGHVGRISAYVDPLHFDDISLHYPEKKFPVKSIVKARILKVGESRIELTCKPSLLSSDCKCLTNYAEAEIGAAYDAVVVSIREKIILLKFFGNVSGILFIDDLEDDDPSISSFFLGQVVRCYVCGFKKEILKVSLKDPKTGDLKSCVTTSLHIGKLYSVKVQDVHESGLSVIVKDISVEGFIPLEQISDHISTSQILLPTIKKGDEFTACCLNMNKMPLFSLNPLFIEFFESPVFKKIAGGYTPQVVSLPAVVMKVQQGGLTLDVPIPQIKLMTQVLRKNVCERGVNDVVSLNIRIHQTLIAFVYKIGKDSVYLASTKLSSVWDRSLKMGVTLLENYLAAHSRALSFYKKHPLGEFHVGCDVEGKVETITDIGAVIKLSNGIQAVVMAYHSKDIKLKTGMNVKGTVMFIDIINKCVEITLKKTVQDMLHGTVKFVPPVENETSVSGLVLIMKPDIEVIAMKIGGAFRIAYVPTHWHINDLNPTKPKYAVGDINKYVVKSVEEGKVICVPKRALRLANLARKTCKHQENDSKSIESRENSTEDIVVSTAVMDNGNKSNENKCAVRNNDSKIVTDRKRRRKENLDENSYKEKIIKTTDFSHTFSCTDEPPILYDEIKIVRNQDDYAKDIETKGKSKEECDGQERKLLVEESTVTKSEKEKAIKQSTTEVRKPTVLTDSSGFNDIENIHSEKPRVSDDAYKSVRNQDNSAKDVENKGITDKGNENQKKKRNLVEGNADTKSKMMETTKQNTIFDEKIKTGRNQDEGANVENKGMEKESSESKNKKKNLLEESNTKSKMKKASKHDKLPISEEIKSVENQEDCARTVENKGITKDNSKNQKKKRNLVEESEDTKSKKKKTTQEITKDCWETTLICDNKKFNVTNNVTKFKVTDLLPVSESEVQITKKKGDCAFDDGNKGILKKGSKKLENSCLVADNTDNKSKKEKTTKQDIKEVQNHTKPSENVKSNENRPEIKSIKSSKNSKDVVKDSSLETSESCLKVTGGFIWDPTPEQLPAVAKYKVDVNQDVSSDEEEKKDSQNSKRKKKRLSVTEKREQARQEEERLRQIEIRLMDSEKNPQSADDFDRLILSSPNNSQNWIKYMSFYLQATEVEKARAVGERALQTISFREEQEKFNIWIALLNLENLYGTKEGFDNTLKEALQLNDSCKVYLQVLQMYADGNKMQELDNLAKLVTKKYGNKETWIQVGTVYMKAGLWDKARNTMQRALTSLEKCTHVEILTKFARLENQYGEAERAETLMEHVITAYPKRVDVWCSYVDMLVKSKKLDLARQVLERAVVQKLPPGKMKTLYKKFVSFEQEHGTPEAVDAVRKMAADYVKSSGGGDD